jgi:hypothetical protein
MVKRSDRGSDDQVKLVKWRMHGRAKLDFLNARVIAAN